MFICIYCLVNYGVVLLLGVVSLMPGLTAGVTMSHWNGGNQTGTPSPTYTTYATTSYCTEVFKYYTTKVPEFYTTTYAAPSHYTDALKYYSTPSYYTTKVTECYMTTHASPSYYTRVLSTTLFSDTYCTDFPKYYSVR
jgi:hypothetical protein